MCGGEFGAREAGGEESLNRGKILKRRALFQEVKEDVCGWHVTSEEESV